MKETESLTQWLSWEEISGQAAKVKIETIESLAKEIKSRDSTATLVAESLVNAHLAINFGQFVIGQYESVFRPAFWASTNKEAAGMIRDKMEKYKGKNFGEERISLMVRVVKAVRKSEGFDLEAFRKSQNPLRESGEFLGLVVSVLVRDVELMPKKFKEKFRGKKVKRKPFLRALNIFAEQVTRVKPVLKMAKQRKKAHPAAFGFTSRELLYIMAVGENTLKAGEAPAGLVEKAMALVT